MRLAVKNGSFFYDQKILFKNVNMEVHGGEILAVLGPNGVGKTTLLKCIMNMLHWKKGCAFLDNRNMNKITEKELWSLLAYVPQMRTASLGLQVKDMVLLGRSARLKLFAQPRDADYMIVERVMKEMNISHLAAKTCNTISGGELQLILIARALAAEPKILIMDEPESNLDYRNQLLVLEMIKRISMQVSCIINTHYPEHALRIADKALILLNDGSNIYGRASEVINEGTLKKSFGINVFINNVSVNDLSYRSVIPLDITTI